MSINISDGCQWLHNELAKVSDNVIKDISIKENTAIQYLKNQFINITPINYETTDSVHVKTSYEVNDKYKTVKYLYNTRLAKNGIPVLNLMEYAEKSPHKGFLRKEFENCKPQIENIVGTISLDDKN